MTDPTVDVAAGGTAAVPAKPRQGRVKCVVWDLDDTLWDGILLEDPAVTVRPAARQVITTLDERGILNSIASRNDHATAMRQLERAGLAGYFLYPEINWNPKSGSVARIATALNLGMDAFAFVDDQPFELDEVVFAHPQVLPVPAARMAELPDWPELTPRFITDESRLRRAMYQSAAAREAAEREFTGGNEAFLATLGMVFDIRPAALADLRRAEELTVRTNQLNSTGITYSYDELARLIESPDHLVLVASLTDRYGNYGTIGLAVVATGGPVWYLKLLLMSCRVMSRGVGTLLLNHVLRLAARAGARLHAEFRPTERNRVMYVTYRFAGFTEVERRADGIVLAGPVGDVPDPPPYVRVQALRQ